MRAAALLLLAAAAPAFAQYRGPAIEACRSYALQEMKRNAASAKDAIIERDRHLLIERRRGRLGSQAVSAVLTGNGAVVYAGTPSAELSFICLLGDEKRPLFFSWLPRADAPALPQCMRDEALRADPRPCLEALLNLAETSLGELYGARLQEAVSRGDTALAAYRKANDEWREYRDAECARRAGDERQRLACLIDLTRRRALDMQ